jgi:hypothetical protein
MIAIISGISAIEMVILASVIKTKAFSRIALNKI